MKKYIKPEVWCIEALFESLLAAESGQIEEGDAKRHNYTLFDDEEDDDSQTHNFNLWDDGWNDIK